MKMKTRFNILFLALVLVFLIGFASAIVGNIIPADEIDDRGMESNIGYFEDCDDVPINHNYDAIVCKVYDVSQPITEEIIQPLNSECGGVDMCNFVVVPEGSWIVEPTEPIIFPPKKPISAPTPDIGTCETDDDCVCHDGCGCMSKNYIEEMQEKGWGIVCPGIPACQTGEERCACIEGVCESVPIPNTTAPVITIITPEQDKEYDDSELTFEVEVDEIAEVTFGLDGGSEITMDYQGISNGILTFTYTVTLLSDGDHTVTFYATDATRNTARATVDFSVDTTPPEAILKFNSQTKDIEVTGYDNIDENVDVSYIGICYEGKCTRTYTLTDDAGNKLVLSLDYKKLKKKIEVEISKMTYYFGNSLGFSPIIIENSFSANFVKENLKTQTLWIENQGMERATYNQKKDETKLIMKRISEKPTEVIINGLYQIWLKTDSGRLNACISPNTYCVFGGLIEPA